jgi:hypothetical protein
VDFWSQKLLWIQIFDKNTFQHSVDVTANQLLDEQVEVGVVVEDLSKMPRDHVSGHSGSWLARTSGWTVMISKNPYQQSISDKELIFDKVV